MDSSHSSANAYTINAFCAAYGIGRTLTYEEIASGRLKARKVGNRTLILVDDAKEWAQALPFVERDVAHG